MHSPLISVIVPIYNVELYLDECLDSIFVQTYTNFEVLLVNDGSTDTSCKIAEKYVVKLPDKFKLFNKKNGGLSDARNYGLNKAIGEYVVFIDSDDFIASNMFEKLVQSSIDNDSDIVCSAMVDVTEQGIKTRAIPPSAIFPPGNYSLNSEDRLLVTSLPNACNKLYKRSLFIQNNIQFPIGLWYEDLATIPKLFYYADRITFIDNELYYYRKREGTITKTYTFKVMDIYRVLEDIRTFFNKHAENNKKIVTEVNTWYINLTVLTLIRLNYVSNLKEQKDAYKLIESAINQHFSRSLDIFTCTFARPIYRVFVFMVRVKLIGCVRVFIKALTKLKVINS